MGEPSLRIFVAMPETTMGERASWASIPEIKRTLLEPVANRLADKLGRSVEIVIEQDKFGEAAGADVYIADLSDANPNVNLELAVRWELDGAVDSVVASVLAAMRDPGSIDSPARTSVELLTAPRGEWDDLRAQVRRLQELQADELVAAAKDVSPAKAIELLRRAIDRNPVSVQAHYQLGVVLNRAADYRGAISELSTATELKPDFAEGWRALGEALGKTGELARAEAAFNRAAEIDPADAETWSNFGGLRRRLARLSEDGKLDWAMLREARSAYQHACDIVNNDTYPLVNVARLDLLLSAVTPSTRSAALASLRRLMHLARFEAEIAKQPGGDTDQKPWKVLDLADTLLLTGQIDEGLAELREAIDLIDPRNREAILTSVIGPLQDFIAVEVLDEQTAEGVSKAIEICKGAIDAVRPRKPGPRKPDSSG